MRKHYSYRNVAILSGAGIALAIASWFIPRGYDLIFMAASVLAFYGATASSRGWMATRRDAAKH